MCGGSCVIEDAWEFAKARVEALLTSTSSGVVRKGRTIYLGQEQLSGK